jgi:hypothetical protein
MMLATTMQIHKEELQHPTQASRVRLNVFEVPPAPNVYGMDALARKGHYLVTEDRIGTTTVVATLGTFASRDDALGRLRRRADELKAQHYTPRAQTA